MEDTAQLAPYEQGSLAALLNRSRGMIREGYGYFAVLSGAVSVFLSAAFLVTKCDLPYDFGSVKGHIIMTLGDPSVNTVVWITALLAFCIYPAIIREARSSRKVLLSHGAILIFLLSSLQWPATFPLLAIGNIAAYIIALYGSSRFLSMSRARAVTLSLATLLGLAIPVELLAFWAWLRDPFAAIKTYSDGAALFAAARFDLGIFYVLYGLTLWLIVILMASPILFEAGNRLVRGRQSSAYGLNIENHRLNAVYLFVGLTGASALAVSVAYIPYALSSYPVGIDAHYYAEGLELLSRGTSLSILMSEEPRAVYLLLLYGVRLATGLPARQTMLAGAAILSVLFVLGTFFAVRETGCGDLPSLLAAFLAVVSAQMLVGTLASIYSQWLALAEMCFFFGFLLRAAKTSSKSSLVASCVLSLAIVVTHPWTWVILLLILLIYVGLSMLRERSFRLLGASPAFKVLCVSVLAGIVLFGVASRFPVARQVSDLGYSWAFLQNLRVARTPIEFFRDLQISLLNYSTGGFYSNSLMLVLAVVGLFRFGRIEWKARTLFESWILAPSVLILLLGWEIQWRLLFLIPYNILAAVGLFTLLSMLRKQVLTQTSSYADSLILKTVQLGLVMFLFLLFLNNAERSMVFIATQVNL